jgi:hypothetical protein
MKLFIRVHVNKMSVSDELINSINDLKENIKLMEKIRLIICSMHIAGGICKFYFLTCCDLMKQANNSIEWKNSIEQLKIDFDNVLSLNNNFDHHGMNMMGNELGVNFALDGQNNLAINQNVQLSSKILLLLQKN